MAITKDNLHQLAPPFLLEQSFTAHMPLLMGDGN